MEASSLDLNRGAPCKAHVSLHRGGEKMGGFSWKGRKTLCKKVYVESFQEAEKKRLAYCLASVKKKHNSSRQKFPSPTQRGESGTPRATSKRKREGMS